MAEMAFEYFDISPCIDLNGAFLRYQTEESFDEDRKRLDAKGTAYKVTWTLYGRHTDENGIFIASAIGDFSTKDDAFRTLNAILAPMAQARDALADARRDFNLDDLGKRRAFLTAIVDVSNDLADVIAQSSDRERL